MEKWKNPKLIVLYRTRPEESVLVVCKVTKQSTKLEGPMSQNSRCFLQIPGCNYKCSNLTTGS